MAWFHNRSERAFGIIEYRGVNAVHWEYRAAVGYATEGTGVGVYAFNSGIPVAYWLVVGDRLPFGLGPNDNYQLVVCCAWRTDPAWSGAGALN